MIVPLLYPYFIDERLEPRLVSAPTLPPTCRVLSRRPSRTAIHHRRLSARLGISRIQYLVGDERSLLTTSPKLARASTRSELYVEVTPIGKVAVARRFLHGFHIGSGSSIGLLWSGQSMIAASESTMCRRTDIIRRVETVLLQPSRKLSCRHVAQLR